jgi:hypothetical protein
MLEDWFVNEKQFHLACKYIQEQIKLLKNKRAK